jgi:hypothetical protein
MKRIRLTDSWRQAAGDSNQALTPGHPRRVNIQGNGRRVCQQLAETVSRELPMALASFAPRHRLIRPARLS